MKLFATARRAIVIAAVLVSSAALAHAARRGGPALDEPGHARVPAPRVAQAPPAQAYDDAPALRTPAATPRTPAPAPGTATPPAPAAPSVQAPARTSAHATLPAAPDRRGEKREHGRATTSGAAQVHRPQSSRAKGPLRNTPATPGMGLLLRFGTNAGREISMNIDDLCQTPATVRSGRDPPRAGPSSNLALAAPPRAPHLAVPPRALRPELHAGVQPSPPDPSPDRTAPARARDAFAPAPTGRAAGRGSPSIHPMERLPRSRAARAKGAAAWLTPPFGGSDA